MTQKILVVDDSSTTRMIIRQELEPAGFDIYEAENGFSGIHKAVEIQPDLITMDVDMPEMNGYEAVYKIRTELKLSGKGTGKKIPIVFITSNDTIAGRRKGFEAGATDFLAKPFLRGELAECVTNLLKPGGSLEGSTVLIAEDSDLSLNILSGILEAEGVKTLQAKDGLAAYEIIKAQEQDIDLVLTDFIMSEMNGDELCRKVRVELGNRVIPIIIISSVSDSTHMLDLFKDGASDYIVKPFAKEELLARARVHLKSSLLAKQLAEQVNKLKRLHKLKDDFLSITSHDLRSPLNGIVGFTDLLLEDPTQSAENVGYLQNVKNSGDFLLNLINDILDLGRVQSMDHDLQSAPVVVQDLIEVSTNTVRHMASPKNIGLIIENRCVKAPIILGDKDALVRVFNNLLSNAIKFTPHGGEVRQIIQEAEDNRLSISIIDTGIGISAAEIPILFDKYTKASKPGTAGEKSTGLGLSITRALIERHKGTVDVRSEVGKGTCFEILLPMAQDIAIDAAEDTEESFSCLTQSAPIRILVADDNQMNIKLVEMILNKKGCDISTAADGKKAYQKYINAINRDDQPFNIIFMDLRMPIMDGFEATDQIRKYEIANMLEHVPIIAMTASIEGSWKDQSQQTGMDGFITKPIDIQKMRDVIKRFVNQITN